MDPITDDLCPGCFTELRHTKPCPHCGYDDTAPRGGLLLPHREVLNGQFVVGRVLGKPGGFGITYLGWDLSLATRVAIKEYLPRDLAGRAADRLTVAAHSLDEGDQFRFGLEQFVREARTLAQIDHPNVVRVRHFFEANGTAYLVMDYYRGCSLAEHLERQGGRLPEEQAKALMLPILDGLRSVHAKGFLHRDLKPQNIYLAQTDSGGVRPILLDFGAARLAMGERSRSLSIVLSPGFAPFEQYHRKGRQGPWTDLYGAAAVLYLLVTGEAPPEATERQAEDELRPAADFGVSRTLSDALGAALAIAPEARPQTVQEFQARVWPGPQELPPTPAPDRTVQPAPGAQVPPPSPPVAPPIPAPSQEPSPPPLTAVAAPRRRGWILALILVLGLPAAALWFTVEVHGPSAAQQFNLGVAYAKGDGVARDDATAVGWYRKAAERGDADAQVNLGFMYANGRGVPQDHREAVQWYRKAAEQGDATAQFNLGVSYARGEGVAQDNREAVQWFRKAADQGDEDAKAALARMKRK